MRAALAFLTVLPVGASAGGVRRTTLLAFPLAGLAIGCAWAVVAAGADAAWGPLVAAALVVALDLALTGALHADAVADVADGLASRRSPEEALRIMREPQVGAVGASVAAAALLLRFGWIATLAEAELWALLAAVPVCGRAGMVVALSMGERGPAETAAPVVSAAGAGAPAVSAAGRRSLGRGSDEASAVSAPGHQAPGAGSAGAGPAMSAPGRPSPAGGSAGAEPAVSAAERPTTAGGSAEAAPAVCAAERGSFAGGSAGARRPSLAAAFADAATPAVVAGAVALAVLACVVAGRLAAPGVGEALGLAALAGAMTVAVGCERLWRRRFGALTGDGVGAAGMAAEACALGVVALVPAVEA